MERSIAFIAKVRVCKIRRVILDCSFDEENVVEEDSTSKTYGDGELDPF